MKVLSVVGARPQFIKAAMLSEELARRDIPEVLVHTGQHYDTAMSEVFFEELSIPHPAYDLGVGSANHGAQTGMMMERLEPIVISEKPDWLVVYGDTNSTLAGALVGAKLNVPVAHVEAGLRSFNRSMPEEINRVVADHVSTLLLTPNEPAAEQLRREGITEGVVVCGNLMVDLALRVAAQLPAHPEVLQRLGVVPKSYGVVTIHRAANTDNAATFERIVEGLRSTTMPLIFPIHPRTAKTAENAGVGAGDNIIVCEPLAYQEMMALVSRAAMIVTDSGGLQAEAYALGIPCVTLREETEWRETIEAGANVLAGSDPARIAQSIRAAAPARLLPQRCGSSASAIVNALLLRDVTRCNSSANAAAKSCAVNKPLGNSMSHLPAV